MCERTLALIVLFLVCVDADLDNCNAVNGSIFGTVNLASKKVADVAECCSLCTVNTECRAWTYAEDEDGTCFLKKDSALLKKQADRTSGVVDRASCKTAADCEFLGACTAGQCVCGSGFKGSTCGELDFAPASAETGGMLWPKPAQILDNSTFSWGFTVVHDAEAGLYDAVVNVGCCRADTCGVTVGGTYLVHLQSQHPDRDFVAKGVFMVPTAFNPHLMRAPNGTYILHFRVNDMHDYRVCQGDGVVTSNSSKLKTYINRSKITHTDPSGEGPGANMYAAWAPTMAGPWSVSDGPLEISGMGNLHISNPSATFLHDGRTLLSFRYNPKGGEANGIAVSDSFLGPFKAVANISKV
jgi:hypothetical protein